MMKVEQKISGSFRTRVGPETFCTVREYLATACRNGRSPLDLLRDLFTAQPFLSS